MNPGKLTLTDVIENERDLSEYAGNISVTAEDRINDDIQVIDADWIQSRFVCDSDLSELDKSNRYHSTAENKFTDTRLGGNIHINPRPQPCRYADPRPTRNRLTRNKVSIYENNSNIGMGRKYSASIDDLTQIVHFTFGHYRFNNIIDFFTRAIDYEDSHIANTGRAPTGYTVGKVLGAGFMLAAFPLITLTVWTIKLATKLFTSHGSFDYYYFEPAMHNYWGTVSTIFTTLTTELGIFAPTFMKDGTEAGKIGINPKIDQDDLDRLRELFPDLISKNNYIDVYAIANRKQVIANRRLIEERKLYEKGDINEYDFLGYVKDGDTVKEAKSAGSTILDKWNKRLSFNEFLNKVTGVGSLFEPKEEPEEPEEVIPPENYNKISKDSTGKYDIKKTKKEQSYLDKLTEYIDASIKDGGMNISFAVDYTGSKTDSFSNIVSDINIGNKANSVATSARNIKFDLAGGNILGETVKDGIGAVKNVMAGALDSVTFGLGSVLQTLTGNSYVDIPKKWDSSEQQLEQHTFSMQFVTLYGDTFSRAMSLYLPLSTILGGVLPMSTGPSSHTSPYSCSTFCKGICDIPFGMITSASITTGITNLAYSEDKRPLSFEVSITVTDFSTLLTAPVASSIFDKFNTALNDNTPLGRYLSTLASRDLLTNKYMIPKVKLKASRLLMLKDEATSPASTGMMMGNSLSNVFGGLVADHALTLNRRN